jgi:hypothetical protein
MASKGRNINLWKVHIARQGHFRQKSQPGWRKRGGRANGKRGENVEEEE